MMEKHTSNFDDRKRYHQYYECPDGSVCVRKEPGDRWEVITGKDGSKAHSFVNQQNKFWKPWIKDSVRRHENHDDEDDTFSRRIKKP